MTNPKVSKASYHLSNTDWTMIEEERKLIQNHCKDEKPGLSEREFGPETNTLKEIYKRNYEGTGIKRYMAFFKFAAIFHIRDTLYKIIKDGNGTQGYKLKGVNDKSYKELSREKDHLLGKLIFTADNKLSEEELNNFKNHILNTFNSNNVQLRAPEILVEVADDIKTDYTFAGKKTSSPTGKYAYTISFPSPACPQ